MKMSDKTKCFVSSFDSVIVGGNKASGLSYRVKIVNIFSEII